eukprot:6296883-Amphidinium_carterae.2
MRRVRTLPFHGKPWSWRCTHIITLYAAQLDSQFHSEKYSNKRRLHPATAALLPSVCRSDSQISLEQKQL